LRYRSAVGAENNRRSRQVRAGYQMCGGGGRRDVTVRRECPRKGDEFEAGIQQAPKAIEALDQIFRDVEEATGATRKLI
jgi:hypothetical protein